MATVTVGELRDYLKELADAVVNGKMQVTDADVKTVLDTIKSVLQSGVNTYDTNALAELQAIKNKLNGTLLTQLTGRKVEVATVLNAVSVNAGATISNVDMGLTGNEVEVWLDIRIDKQPWSLYGTTNIYGNTNGGQRSMRVFYPSYENHTSTYTSLVGGARALYLGLSYFDLGDLAPLSFTEAKAIAVPPLGGNRFSIRNGSSEIATITVQIIKVYR